MIETVKKIYRIRREEGRPDKALELGRQTIAKGLQHDFLPIAMGWCIFDLLKSAIRHDRQQEVKDLVAEFQSLEIPSDELVHTKVTGLIQHVGKPWAADVAKGNDASRSKDWRTAVQHFRRAKELAGDAAHDFHGDYGWCLRDGIRTATENEDAAQLRTLLLEYARLTVTKPSLLHSLILFWATKAAEKHQDYVRFIKWWDLNHLRADDFKRSDKSTDGKEFPSLAESVSKALVKHVDSQRHSQDLEWIAKWLQTLCRQFSDNDWLPYRLAKVLVMLNRFEEARDLLVPIVRHKQGEPWAWHSLAGTFSSLGDHNAIACLCRANNLGREEVYLRNARLDLAEHFLAIGRTQEARREVDKVVSDCEQQGHNLPKKLQALLTRIPSTEVRAGSNTEVYAEFQPLADELLTEHLPWRNAIISGVVRREGKKDPLVFALVASESADDSTRALVPTPVTRQLDNIALGLPVAVKIEDSSKGTEVVAIRSRESTAWDLLDPQLAVADHVNPDRHVIHVIVGDQEHGLIRFEELEDAKTAIPGDVFLVRFLPPRPGRDMVEVVTVERTAAEPPRTFSRVVSGVFRSPHTDGKFGFINISDDEEDIFVSPQLVDRHALTDGRPTSGLAVLAPHPKKDEWSWKLLTVVGSE